MPPRDLTQGPLGRTLFVFALPVLGGNVLQSLNGSVNAVWVGRFLGEEALTAIANANANANNIMFLLLGGVRVRHGLAFRFPFALRFGDHRYPPLNSRPRV